MTNEELAERIKGGDKELTPILWEGIVNFVRYYINKYILEKADICKRAGVEFDDLLQEGYFAFIDAIEAYKPSKGFKFITFMSYPMLNRFNDTIGLRTANGRNSALNTSTSLEAKIGANTEGITLADTIEDTGAFAEMEDVIEREYHKKLHDDLETCMKVLEPLEKKVIKEKYYKGKTASDIGRQMGVGHSRVRTIEYKALTNLRRKRKQRKLLEPYKIDIINTHAYRSGFTLWKETGTSSTEYTALFLMEKEGLI